MKNLLLALLACTAAPVAAATFTVSKTADTADGVCDADCSLREAVMAANDTAGGDEIELPAGTYQLTRGPGDGAPFGVVVIDDDDGDATADSIVLRGAGAASTTIEQTVSPAGVLQLQSDLGQATIQDVTLRGGRGVDGACLQSFAPTTLERLVFTDCHGDDDGGAAMTFEPLVVHDTLFAENDAIDDGGALMTFGEVTVTDTTFRDNRAGDDAGAWMPFEPDSLQPLILERVTFHGNRAGDSGGAMMSFTPFTATNCTFSDNEAGAVLPTLRGVAPRAALVSTGGAIHAFDPLRLVHATLTDNHAVGGGGGIFNAYRPSVMAEGVDAGPLAVEFQATIVASNTPDDCADDPFGDPVTPHVSLGHVLDSDDSCVTGATGDQTAADPGLAALADNGGATLTHALLATSPAIDAAGDTCAVDTDQRGVARPMDGDQDGTALCDVGAYEVEGPSVTTTTTTPGATTTTTLPGGCDRALSFASILCRLDALRAATDAAPELGKQQKKLQKNAGKARDLTERGQQKCAAGDKKAKKKSGKDLKKAGRKLSGYRRALRSRNARRRLEESVRETFLAQVEPLNDDVKAFRKSLVCPDDATPALALQPSR